jgi:hypothetical protein
VHFAKLRIRAVSGGLSNNPENTWGFGVAHFINLAEYLDEKVSETFFDFTLGCNACKACCT